MDDSIDGMDEDIDCINDDSMDDGMDSIDCMDPMDNYFFTTVSSGVDAVGALRMV